MSGSWRDDPRVKSMDPEKVQFLSDLTEQLRQTPRSRMMNRLLGITLEASRRGITFSDQETDLMARILADHMSPADRGRIDMFRTLSRQMAARSRTGPAAGR